MNGTLTAVTANTKLRFAAGITVTPAAINFNGQATGTRVTLHSGTPGTLFTFTAGAGSRTISNTSVKDSSALNEGVIDTIGSDHAPHKLGEKAQPLCKCPSGVPGIETTLPLMISAWKDGKVTLAKIVELLHTNPQRIFKLKSNDDLVLVDIVNYRTLSDEQMASKCQWTPFIGMKLTGFPRYVFTQNTLIECAKL
jgi:hypothetical protein